MNKLKVLLIGSGGVGTIGAYAMEYSGKATVTSVVRSDYSKVVDKGYDIESCDYGTINGFKTTNIVNSVEGAKKFGPFDYLVVTTKNLPDISPVEGLIAPVVSPNTSIVLIQNGINIGAPIIEKFPQNVVLSGVQMISSTNYNGRIVHEGQDNIKIGFFKNPNIAEEIQEAQCHKFISIYKNKHNVCEYDENVNYTRWRKLVYNATLNPICTLTGVDTGRLELFGGYESMVKSAMREVLDIAKSDSVELPESIMEFMLASDGDIYYSPSMLVDLRKGNYMEIEVICGNALRVAEKNNVKVPTLALIYNLLKVVQCKTMESKGLLEVPKKRPLRN